MSSKEFSFLLSCICASVINKICAEQKIAVNEAISVFYSSRLYAILENENTKVWHYSSSLLYDLFCEEQQTGRLVLPD